MYEKVMNVVSKVLAFVLGITGIGGCIYALRGWHKQDKLHDLELQNEEKRSKAMDLKLEALKTECDAAQASLATAKKLENTVKEKTEENTEE